MSERCKNCDHPIATDADWEHYHDCTDDGCTYGADLCWDQPCVREPVDWRERWLAAQSTLAHIRAWAEGVPRVRNFNPYQEGVADAANKVLDFLEAK